MYVPTCLASGPNSSSHALQYFYEEQLHRMECLSQEPVLFEDVLCQIHDMVQPAEEGIFTLQDLKRQKSLAGILFNILFNLNKFIAFETRDPFVVRQVSSNASSSDSASHPYSHLSGMLCPSVIAGSFPHGSCPRTRRPSYLQGCVMRPTGRTVSSILGL